MPRKRWRRTGKQLRSIRVWQTRLVFWGGAIVVGLAATILAWASDFAGETFAHWTTDRLWLPFLITPLGLLFIIWVTRRWFPDAEGSGIPQAIAMLMVKDEKLRHRVLGLRVALAKGVMVVLGLLFGASIGREGPTVHIAAGLSLALTRLAKFPLHVQERGLILAGSAAGLSAAFNTPLAGIVFAIEEISRNFEERTSGVVLTAVILAGMTALTLQGNYVYFGRVDFDAITVADIWIAVLACGVLGGLLGGLFSQALIVGGRRLRPLRRAHPYLFAAACGLLLATIGLATAGATFGTGYDEARRALDIGAISGVWFPLAKLAATLVSYLSGIPGGIFAPSLASGAGLGAVLAQYLPALPTAAVVLLAMTGYFTGVVQSPITAVVIVMEMTGDPQMLLPVMATALVAEWVASHVCPKPLYRALAQSYLRDTLGDKEAPPTAEPASGTPEK